MFERCPRSSWRDLLVDRAGANDDETMGWTPLTKICLFIVVVTDQGTGRDQSE